MQYIQIMIAGTVFISFTANALGPDYRGFLVEQQPMTNTLFIVQTYALTEPDIQYKNNVNNEKIKYRKTRFDVSPTLITNKPSSFSAISLGYINEEFTSTNNSFSKNYSGIYSSSYAISEFNLNWYWNAFLSYGLFSNGDLTKNGNNDKTFAFSSIGYKKNSKKVYKLGLLYNSNFGHDKILPAFGITYNRSHYILDIFLPLTISIRKIHSQRLHSIFKAEISYASYYDSNKKDILEISGSEVGLTVEYNIYSYAWLHAGVSYVSEKELTWLNIDDNFATIEAHYKVAGGINVRF